MKNKKALYRVYNTETKKYLSAGYKPKTTWHSSVWATRAAASIIYDNELDASKIEIHIFPVVDAIKVSYENFKKDSYEF
ncbi:MAG: hypothetical protein ABIP51_16310 [Bacteroidia bacterium]